MNLLSNGSFAEANKCKDAVRNDERWHLQIRRVRLPVPHDLTLVQDPTSIVLKDLNVFFWVNIK